MLIIVEGVDGVGKTTLCDMIEKEVISRGRRVDRRKCSQPKRHVLEEYVYDVEDYRPTQGAVRVYDRYHLGEMIYGPLYRGKSQLDDAQRRYVELVLQARGGLFVVMHPRDTATWVRELFMKRGETFLRREDAEHVADWFASASREIGPVVPWNLHDYGTESGVRALVDTAEVTRREARGTIEEYPSLIGNATENCRYLLLGDTRGKPQLSFNGRRFQSCFLPIPTSSGHYLMRAIPREVDRLFAVVNANDEHSLTRLWQRLGRPYVCALGRNAEQTARQAFGGIAPIGTVPHPQYVRRFHNKRVEEYGEMIVYCAREGDTWRP